MRSRTWSTLALLALSLFSHLCVAQAGSRQYYVTDRGTNRILRYDADTGAFLGELVGPANPSSGNELDEPVAMAISPNNTLLVANRGSGRVVQYDRTTGSYLGNFASGLDQPTDLLVYNNQVFISSLGPTGFDGDTIYRFSANGAAAGHIVTGDPTGRTGLAVGKDGKLYAGSFFDGQVLKIDLSNGSSSNFGAIAGAGTGYLGFDASENLLAVGLFSFNVSKLNGQTGASLGQFIAPTAGLFFPSDLLPLTISNELLITSIGNDDPTLGLPLGFGYISKFNLATGAVVNPFFIAGTGGLQQPTSVLYVNSLIGDLNGDDFVGQDDLNLVLGLWGQRVSSGNVVDVNRDGFIGQDDLNAVLGTWGQGSLPTLLATRGASVPEASSLVMVSLATVAGWLAYRRRSSSQ